MFLEEFAKTGTEADFEKKLRYLASMAEREVWDLNEKSMSYKYKKGTFILRKYILLTFDRCTNQDKIVYSKDKQHCAINTGLLTEKDSKDIYMMFDKNLYSGTTNVFGKKEQDWYFSGFKTATDRDYIEAFGNEEPEMATYTEDVNDFYFNPNLRIEIDLDHIIDDNWDRIQDIVRLPKEVVRTMFGSSLISALKRSKRNIRIAIPQFYNDKIGFFLPIEMPVNDRQYVTLALAIEKVGDMYRANTIFTLADAYVKARRIMQVDNNWLLN